MTTRHASGTDGAGRRPNTGAQRRSAEARTCPTCGRGAALVSVRPRPVEPGETTTHCRWDDCSYARVVPFEVSSPTPHGSGRPIPTGPIGPNPTVLEGGEDEPQPCGPCGMALDIGGPHRCEGSWFNVATQDDEPCACERCHPEQGHTVACVSHGWHHLHSVAEEPC